MSGWDGFWIAVGLVVFGFFLDRGLTNLGIGIRNIAEAGLSVWREPHALPPAPRARRELASEEWRNS